MTALTADAVRLRAVSTRSRRSPSSSAAKGCDDDGVQLPSPPPSTNGEGPVLTAAKTSPR